MIVQSSFPEYIVITLGTGFPLSGGGNTGYLGLFEDDQMVLKRMVLSGTQVSYTESGSITPSLLVAAPGPIASPKNRIRINMKMTPGTGLNALLGNNMSGIGAGSPNAWVDLSSAVTVAYLAGWSNIPSWSAWGSSGVTTAFPYNFLDIVTWIEPATIKNMEEYLPVLQVTGSTGGTFSVSEANPSYNESVTVTAIPSSGYTFTNWTDGIGGSSVSTNASYTFNMPFVSLGSSYDLYANFTVKKEFQLISYGELIV